jgi:hypothetical protein
MLLHMVKPSHPIDLTAGLLCREGGGKQVRDPLAFVHHIRDLDSPQVAAIERLATGGWKEGSLVEVDAAGIVRPLYDHRLEVAKVGIGIIESVGHGEPGASEWG